jgi:hypothetical protein
MNVKFIKDWTNPETGSTHKEGTFHKIGNEAALELIEQGYCLRMPDELGLLQLYKNPELIPDEYLKPAQVDKEDVIDFDEAVNRYME